MKEIEMFVRDHTIEARLSGVQFRCYYDQTLPPTYKNWHPESPFK